MNIIVNAIEAGVRTVNGNIYPKEVLEGAVAKFHNDKRHLFIYANQEDAEKNQFGRSVGVVNDVKLKNNKLELECNFLKHQPMYKIIIEILKSGKYEIIPVISAGLNEAEVFDPPAKIVQSPATILTFVMMPKEP